MQGCCKAGDKQSFIWRQLCPVRQQQRSFLVTEKAISLARKKVGREIAVIRIRRMFMSQKAISLRRQPIIVLCSVPTPRQHKKERKQYCASYRARVDIATKHSSPCFHRGDNPLFQSKPCPGRGTSQVEGSTLKVISPCISFSKLALSGAEGPSRPTQTAKA